MTAGAKSWIAVTATPAVSVKGPTHSPTAPADSQDVDQQEAGPHGDLWPGPPPQANTLNTTATAEAHPN